VTETEWLACTDTIAMLDFHRDTASDRELRLLIAGGLRFLCRGFSSPRVQETLDAFERFADRGEGLTLGDAIHGLGTFAEEMSGGLSPLHNPSNLRFAFLDGLEVLLNEHLPNPRGEIDYRVVPIPPSGWLVVLDQFRESFRWSTDNNDRQAVCRIVRDLFGNPFREVVIDPTWLAWNDGMVQKLARGIDDEKATDRLPILADALEDAGCDNADVLTHCRSGGEHWRGCWVIDLLLGKE
jgi:hypothetical protein